MEAWDHLGDVGNEGSGSSQLSCREVLRFHGYEVKVLDLDFGIGQTRLTGACLEWLDRKRGLTPCVLAQSSALGLAFSLKTC